MPSPGEVRAALVLLTGEAVTQGAALLRTTSGDPTTVRYKLLNQIPDLIGYYSDGSSALAADFYNDERALQAPAGFTATPVVPDRYVKQRRAVAWATQPLFEEQPEQAAARLGEVIQYETATPFRDTIRVNRAKDPAAVGWRRVTTGKGCPLCRMLAARGAVYTEKTVRFAAHSSCHCTAQPVFKGGSVGPTASVMQYTASRKTRTPAQQAQLRQYLTDFYSN